MGKKKIRAKIVQMIEDLEAGKAMHFWDAEHQPREGERKGRVAMLYHILELFEAEEKQ